MVYYLFVHSILFLYNSGCQPPGRAADSHPLLLADNIITEISDKNTFIRVLKICIMF